MGAAPPPPPPAVWPTPVSVTVAEAPPLAAMLSVAVFEPALVGRNVTDTVVDAPAVSVVVPGKPTWNCDGSVPVIVNGAVSVIVDVVLFVTLTGPRLALPTVVVGNVSVPGSALSAGPVPPDDTMSTRNRGSTW